MAPSKKSRLVASKTVEFSDYDTEEEETPPKKPAKIYQFKQRLMQALKKFPVNCNLAKQIQFAMESQARLTAVRQKMAMMSDDQAKMKIFEDFQRENFTRKIMMQKENSKPKRKMKQKWELLKCVNSFNKVTNKQAEDA